MKIKHIALMGAALLAASAFMSCTQEPMMKIPAEEAYARAFIRQFGLIDPAQDWNLAQEGTVTVNVPGHANSVKVYAKVGEKYYMVADLVNIEGSITIPVDIPETTNDLMVKVDGRKYYTTNGGTVTAGSRTIPTEASGYVSVDYNSYIEFDMDIIEQITGDDGVLPEEQNNDGKDDVIKNFTMKYDGAPLTFYPVYFNSSSNHILGVCWIVDEAEATENGVLKDGYAKILISHEVKHDESWQIISEEKTYRYVRKLPVYYDKVGSELQYADINPHPGNNDETESYHEGYDQDLWLYNGDILSSITANLDGIWNDNEVVNVSEFAKLKNDIILYYQAHPLTNQWCGDCNAQVNFEVYDVISVEKRHVTLKIRHSLSQGGESGETPSVWKDYVTNPSNNIQSADKSYMRAAPVTIDLSSYLNINDRYLFYIDVFTSSGVLFDDESYKHSVYSYAPLNYCSEENATPHYPVESAYPTSYAAYYTHTFDDDVERTFFSFEDWAVQKRDLNDLIFMVKTSTDPGYEPPVVNEDQTTTTTTETETLTWLIAAEDLGTTDDFDFNDVVFTLTSVTTNKSTTTTTTTTTSQGGQVTSQEGTTSTTTEIHKEVKVQALAAGGTLPVWLHYSDGTNDYILGPNKVVLNDGNVSDADKDACEWHQWFDKSSSDMVNTGRGATVAKPACLTIGYSKDTTNPVSHEGSWLISAFGAEEFSMAQYSQTLKNGTVEGFYITVGTITGEEMQGLGGTTTSDITKNPHVIGVAKTGAAPQMFIIPDVGYNNGKWHWPSERYHILECYPGFKTWVENAETGKDWHKEEPAASVFRVNP